MVNTWRSYWFSFKKYSSLEKKEITAIIIGSAVLALIIGLDDGSPEFVMGYWLRNLFNCFLIVLLALIVKQIAQRATSTAVGFKPEYKPWLYGLGIGIILALASKGKLWFLAPGGIVVYHLAGHRLGTFRYGLNYWPLGIIGLMGPVSSLILAIFFKVMLGVFPQNALILLALKFNLYFAGFSMLPIPPLDGTHLFFASRMVYAFAFGTIIALCFALFYLPIIWALPIGLLVGIGAVVLNAFVIEK